MACPGSNASDGNNTNEGNTQLQDVEWLASLSEPEIDFLISLKELAIRRAKNAGYKVLADKFDLRMLRALSLVLLEFFKERVQSSSEIPDSDEILRQLNGTLCLVTDCHHIWDINKTVAEIGGLVLLEFFKERVQSSSEIPDSDEILRRLNGCSLSILNGREKSESNATAEGSNDLSFVSPMRKRMRAGLCEETPKRQKRLKTADSDK